MLRTCSSLIITLLMSIVMWIGSPPAEACVEGMSWGMSLDQVEAHLGVTEPEGSTQPQRYLVRNVSLDQIPVSKMAFDLDQIAGLQSLAYEFAMDDMTEVLAGLRAKHGHPISTTLEDGRHHQHMWVWNTGEDMISAVQSNSGGHEQFLISYRPSRLRPEIL